MVKKIALSRGLFALVDDEDFEAVSAHKWFTHKGGKNFYAVRSGGILMHREIMGPAKTQEVDHRDGDGLNNCRANLRVCSHKENLRNKKKQPRTQSKYKGVWLQRSGKWRAGIEQNGEKLMLGSFNTEEQAARQYDRAARILFGAFAKTNSSMGFFHESSTC